MTQTPKERKKKKAWHNPTLIVLVRGDSAESVLITCKCTWCQVTLRQQRYVYGMQG